MTHARTVAANHPSLPGHFPGNPVVPGVVLLDLAADALAQELGRPCRVVAFPHVKFTAPVPPGGTVEFAFRIDAARGCAELSATLEGQPVLTGRLDYILES